MSRVQSHIRLIISYALGAFFLAESLNPNFWRPHIESLSPLIHVFVAVFGLMWLVQAVVIPRQLRKQRS